MEKSLLNREAINEKGKEREREIEKSVEIIRLVIKGRFVRKSSKCFIPDYYIYWGLESNGKIRERERDMKCEIKL